MYICIYILWICILYYIYICILGPPKRVVGEPTAYRFPQSPSSGRWRRTLLILLSLLSLLSLCCLLLLLLLLSSWPLGQWSATFHESWWKLRTNVSVGFCCMPSFLVLPIALGELGEAALVGLLRGGQGTADRDTVASNCPIENCLSNSNKRISSKSSNWESWARWRFPTVSSPLPVSSSLSHHL